MKEINSKSNQSYKLFQKLNTKKYRDKLGLYLIEGENLLEEAFKNGAEVDSILIRDDEKNLVRPWMEESRVFVVEKKLFKELAQTETSQGVMAAVKKPELSLDKFYEDEDFVVNGSRNSLQGNLVILDRLQDPGNIGTIIRTADAAGYGLIIAMKGTADIFAPKVVRAAAGSLFRMNIAIAETEEELIRFIRAAGKKLVTACPVGSRYYYEEDISRNVALIVGNEGNGISDSLIEKSDLKVNIPMSGNIESLNVSAAAAILMYEAVRRKQC